MNKGDRIRFLDAPEGGQISNILPNKKVEVVMDSGITVIVSISEICKDYSTPADFEKPIKTHPYYIQKTKAEKKQKNATAVDLHIKISPVLDISNGDIIEIQLNKLTTAVNQALADRTRELIVIHGVGKGTLKKAVIDFAGNHKLIKSVVDADKKQYGDGASKLIFF